MAEAAVAAAPTPPSASAKRKEMKGLLLGRYEIGKLLGHGTFAKIGITPPSFAADGVSWHATLKRSTLRINWLNKLGFGGRAAADSAVDSSSSAIAQGPNDDIPVPGQQFAQFGAGCFWGVELAYQRVSGVSCLEESDAVRTLCSSGDTALKCRQYNYFANDLILGLAQEKMPCPGPRPYECVRRAWDSERHQPMRGLIIQQIFRLVHENHSAATKKNKEWQEKLPVVVLKAEEIMYSKVIKNALSKVLVHFYPSAGRLTISPEMKLIVDCTGEGAVFVEAEEVCTSFTFVCVYTRVISVQTCYQTLD